MEIADGLSLLPGEDGTLPVRLRWVAATEIPEAVGVDGDRLYVAASTLIAFALSDGAVIWENGGDDALEASGGVKIGIEGTDVLRVFAPWEYDIRVDRNTGRLLSRHPAFGTPPEGFSALAAERPASFRVVADLETIDAFWPDGRLAWRLVVESPFVDPQRPVEAGGAIVLVTSGQHLVVLDVVSVD